MFKKDDTQYSRIVQQKDSLPDDKVFHAEQSEKIHKPLLVNHSYHPLQAVYVAFNKAQISGVVEMLENLKSIWVLTA